MIGNLHLTRPWVMALLAAVLLSGSAIALASPATIDLISANGSGYDPLSPAEQTRALESLRGAGVQAESLFLPSAAPALTSDTVSPAPAEVVLLIERHQEDKQVYATGRWPRRADVYLYRYTDNTLIRQIYNLDSGQVEQVDAVQGVQLPLTAEETQRALAIALNDQTLRPRLDAEYQLITHGPLVSADQLDVKAMVFHADAAPGVDLQAAGECGLRRCAQLLLATADNVALPVIPIIDLSSGVVLTELAFDGATMH